MFNEVEGLLQRVTTGEIDQNAVSQAAGSLVSSTDHQQLTQQVQNAAQTADQNGESGIAQQLTGLLQQHGSNPQGLQQELVSVISSNPQILQHFEPAFVKNILGNI